MAEHFAAALVLGTAGEYAVVFPDFPGAGAGGDKVQEALARATENLAVHIEGRIEAGLDMPRLRSIDEVKADPEGAEEIAEAEAIALVPVDLSGKAQRVNITIDEALLTRIDKAATRLGESRSGLLAAAARARIAGLV
jgi:predicted RNase H-like HicB family nuclease